MGIGNHGLVDFLPESGFAKREEKNGESLAKRVKTGLCIVVGNVRKNIERDVEN